MISAMQAKELLKLAERVADAKQDLQKYIDGITERDVDCSDVPHVGTQCAEAFAPPKLWSEVEKTRADNLAASNVRQLRCKTCGHIATLAPVGDPRTCLKCGGGWWETVV